MDESTILLLDGDRIARGHLERSLREQGYRVIAADDGASGLDYAKRMTSGLVIIDILLPGRSAFAVIEQIRRMCPPLRIIVLSCLEGAAHRALAELLGADEYLKRPLSLNRLHEVAQRLCPLPAPSVSGARQPVVPPNVTTHAG